MHLTNIDSGVADQIYKLFSMILCANTLGQAQHDFSVHVARVGQKLLAI